MTNLITYVDRDLTVFRKCFLDHCLSICTFYLPL